MADNTTSHTSISTLLSQDDIPKAKEVINRAFDNDPTWCWMFPEADVRHTIMPIIVEGMQRFPHSYKTPGLEAVALWVPPGESELSEELEEAVPDILRKLVGDRFDEVMATFDLFESHHPQDPPHYYLSLLSTHPDHGGKGLGMALLKENLAAIDKEDMPAYLESSNPVNNKRYESVGFKTICTYQVANNGPEVSGMWRERQSLR